MKPSLPITTLAFASALALSACTGSGSPAPSPTASATATTEEPSVSPHESGPESPIGFGVQVPIGATQLGPLVRIRSQKLIDDYLPDLATAEEERDVQLQQEAEEDAEPGETPTTPTPTPTPTTGPSQDSFSLLDEAPRPDTVISVMRVDGDPTLVVRRMLAQLAALLPEEEIPTTDLTELCTVADQRVQSCRLGAQGKTPEGRDVRALLTVDPGDVATRTAPPAAQLSPVMTLQLTYVGDPRTGQAERESNDLPDVAEVSDEDTSGLIWPRMDLDADRSSPLVDGWRAPDDAQLLLSGYRPQFAALVAPSAKEADETASTWVADRIEGEPSKDVVEDLNEVSTTYAGSGSDGSYYRAVHVLSARGSYVMLFVYPKGTSH